MCGKLRKQLEQFAEADYKAFNEKLLPGVTNVLGVRLPKLREIAKQAVKEDAQAFLQKMREMDWKGACYEEKMIYGLAIGYANMDDAGHREQLDAFVPLIDNWGVCDSVCTTCKWMRKRPEFWWDYLNQWMLSDMEYGIRFALVAMLDHFVDERHIREILAVCGQVKHEGYYVKMALAWLISVCFVKFPEETYAWLRDNLPDDFTHKKSIQKICESYRVSDEWKAKVRTLLCKK